MAGRLESTIAAAISDGSLSPFSSLFVFLPFTSVCPLLSDLNKFSDTGVVPTGIPAVNIPPFLMYADDDEWLPTRVGFSIEGWYKTLSWNHAHSLFSNGPTEPSYVVGKHKNTTRR